MSLSDALSEALADHPMIEDRDKAIVELARVYAAALDRTQNPNVIIRLGAELQSALETLHMTPRARSSVKPQGGAPLAGTNPLAQLRDELAERRSTAG
jgi:hypothetical protein